MTKINIKEFVDREILLCVSSLVYELTQPRKCPSCKQIYNCIDEEVAIELWTGSIDYEEAEYAINQDGSYLAQKDGLWGLYDNDEVENPIVDYEYESKEQLTEWYFEDMGWDINDYRSEIFEHWIVTSWLANKLEALGETVVRDFYGLCVWGRTTTGQSIWCDYIIQEIYSDLISQTNG